MGLPLGLQGTVWVEGGGRGAPRERSCPPPLPPRLPQKVQVVVTVLDYDKLGKNEAIGRDSVIIAKETPILSSIGAWAKASSGAWRGRG